MSSFQRVVQKTDQRSRQQMEHEASFRLSLLMRREFGITPKETSATLSMEGVCITLRDALSPLGHIIAQSPDGTLALQDVYMRLYQAHYAQMEALIAHIVGRPVLGSKLEISVKRGDVCIRFELEPQPK